MEEKQSNLATFKPDSRDWHIYNLAKTQEKRVFYELLKELSEVIVEPQQEIGRPRAQVKDLFFSLGLKLYSNYSGRKVISDLKHAQGAGYIGHSAHYNTLTDFLSCPATYDLLQRMLTISAMPLKQLETRYSIDSSGFGSYQYERWKRYRFSPQFGGESRNYLKGHISIGTITHIITACEVTYGNLSDINQMPYLLKVTAQNFRMKEVCADKAYSSARMHQLIESLQATPYIIFKKNSNPAEDSPSIWQKMYTMFKEEPAKYLAKYHQRSNVETVFSMVKMRLGEFLKCKTYDAQRSELMTKFIVHNICCLVQAIFQYGVTVDFKACEKAYNPQEEHEKRQGLRADTEE